MLPPLAQAYVMRTLYIQQEIPLSVVNSWSNINEAKAKTKHQQAMSCLRKFNIMIESGKHVRVNEMFQSRILAALCCIKSVSSFGDRCIDIDEKDKVLIEDVEKFAIERWEAILHFMVGSQHQGGHSISKNIKGILEHSGLMANSEDMGLTITNKGFQFLLQDVNTQIWSFLIQFAEAYEAFGMNIPEIFNFFFFLSTLEYGSCYSTLHFSENQKTLLFHLCDFGIIYLRKKSAKLYYPTKYAAVLGSTKDVASLSSKKQDNFLIIETNYRIYAYTDSPLQISVLGLFAHLKCRFNGFCVGIVTRESVRQALSNGITAKQIVHYLRTHAHPQMKKQNPVIPSTIVDQITLWELERNRLRINEGYLYKDFSSADEFIQASKYARDLDVLLWENGNMENPMMFVSSQGHEAVKAFVKSLISQRQVINLT